MSNQPEQVSNNQALATVVRFLKQHNLNATVDALQKEIGLSSGGDGTGSGANHHSLNLSSIARSNPDECRQSYTRFNDFIESSLDLYRAELSQLRFPLFVHLYIELVGTGHSSEAQDYFTSFHGHQESFFIKELNLLKSMTSPEHLNGNALVECFKKNKFSVRMSNDTYQSLLKFLQVKQESLLLGLINQHFSISVFDGAPRTEVDIQTRSGALLGEPATTANKSKVLYGIAKDPDLMSQLVEMEEEREEGQDEDKPKKKKAKKDLSGKKSKSGATPHAPPLTRIPLPKLRDCEMLAKYKAYKESSKCVSLSPTNPPSICFYSLLNTRNCLNNVVISKDSSLLAGLFSDSSVRVWTLTPQRLLSMLPSRLLTQIPLSAEDVTTRMMDPLSASEVHVLRGHNGPVFSAAFNPDNSLLITSSEDGTIRLWSLQLFTTLMVFKAHNHCVWSVDFGPNGYYFASGSQDRTACVWTTENPHPLRMLVGHTSDVDVVKFHPNGNYVATGSSDRTVRLWDILNGDCVRIFSGMKDALTAICFSPDGKYIASSGADPRILVWCIPSAKQAAEFKGHSESVYTLIFSRDNSILSSGGLDCSVKLWDCTPLDEENTIATGPMESFQTKDTSVVCLHFTRRNLLLGAGASQQ